MFIKGTGPVIYPYLDGISLGVILSPIGGLATPHLIFRGKLSSGPSFISSVMTLYYKEGLLSMFESVLI